MMSKTGGRSVIVQERKDWTRCLHMCRYHSVHVEVSGQCLGLDFSFHHVCRFLWSNSVPFTSPWIRHHCDLSFKRLSVTVLMRCCAIGEHHWQIHSGKRCIFWFYFLNLCLLSSHMKSLSACYMSFDIQALTEMYSLFYIISIYFSIMWQRECLYTHKSTCRQIVWTSL